MKLIYQIHSLITLATNKGIAGYYSDTQVDDAIDRGQMRLFRDLLKEFPKDKRVRNNLLPFEVRASITITSKIGSLPSDFEHEIEAWYTASSVDYPIQIVEPGFYRTRIRDVVDPPSTTNLFGSIYYDTTRKIEISSNVTPITLNYFKKPTKPVFATTLSSGQYIYDDAGSTDVLWSSTMHDILEEYTWDILGLNIRDLNVMRAGQKSKPNEMTL